MNQKTITILPKKEAVRTDAETGVKLKKQVCAYARVSTDLDDQKNSFRAQLEEYQNRINKNPEWEFVRLYSDEGISGTSIKNRKGFAEMISDALSGKIDLILTKSISRFARNTVDCLQTVRDLREHNVEVFFDKENISTTDPKIEMMLTIFASMAQEESKSISENVKWGVRKRMAKGQRKIQSRTLLGYDNDENGNLIINEAESEIVKKIFNLYVAGYSIVEIQNYLKESSTRAKCPSGQWTVSYISRMLSNEKYVGDVLLQKTVVVDFLTHKAVKNDGIEESYYIKNHHPAIIERRTFDYVQAIKASKLKEHQTFENYNADMMCGSLFCESCLRQMYKVSQHPGTQYQRFVYTCKNAPKTDANYIECHSSGTVDYNCLKEATTQVFIKYFQPPMDFQEIMLGEFENAMAITTNYQKMNVLDAECKDLEKKLDEIVKKQIESLDDSALDDEFQQTKKEILEKRAEMELCKTKYNDGIFISKRRDSLKRYFESKFITPMLLKETVRKIIVRQNGSLLYVIGNYNFSLTREKLNHLLLKEPIDKGSVFVDGRNLDYEVIREEIINND